MSEALVNSRDVTVPAWLLGSLPPGLRAHLAAGGRFDDLFLAWR